MRELTGSARWAGTPAATARTPAALVVEHGGFRVRLRLLRRRPAVLDRGAAATDGSACPHLVVPYTLDANDMRFATPQGFNTAHALFRLSARQLRRAVRRRRATPRMLSSACTAACSGAPAAFRRCSGFLDHIEHRAHDRVWVTRRIDIAPIATGNSRARPRSAANSPLNQPVSNAAQGSMRAHPKSMQSSRPSTAATVNASDFRSYWPCAAMIAQASSATSDRGSRTTAKPRWPKPCARSNASQVSGSPT
jgi:hypothetical protein